MHDDTLCLQDGMLCMNVGICTRVLAYCAFMFA